MDYNKEIYGPASMSPGEVVARLKSESCINADGKIVKFPDWLTGANIMHATGQVPGIREVHYGPSTYGHVDLYIVEG